MKSIVLFILYGLFFMNYAPQSVIDVTVVPVEALFNKIGLVNPANFMAIFVLSTISMIVTIKLWEKLLNPQLRKIEAYRKVEDVICGFLDNQILGIFAKPNKLVSVIMMLIPFVAFFGSYIVFSEAKTAENAKQKLFPVVEKVGQRFVTNGTEPDKRIDRGAYKEWKAINKALESIEKGEPVDFEALEKASRNSKEIKEVDALLTVMVTETVTKDTKELKRLEIEAEDFLALNKTEQVSLLKEYSAELKETLLPVESWKKLSVEELKSDLETKQLTVAIPASKLYTDTVSSLSRVFIAMAISSVIALFIALHMGLFPAVEKTLDKFLTFFGSLQPVAILPIVMLLAGVEDFGKIVFITTVLTTTILLAIYKEVKAVPMQSLIKSLTLGASQLQLIYTVVLPQIFPKFLDVVRSNFYLGSIYC